MGVIFQIKLGQILIIIIIIIITIYYNNIYNI